MNKLTNNFFLKFPEEYMKEIEEMNEPNEYQAVKIKQFWDMHFGNRQISTSYDKVFWAQVYAKLYIKCLMTFPELFI